MFLIIEEYRYLGCFQDKEESIGKRDANVRLQEVCLEEGNINLALNVIKGMDSLDLRFLEAVGGVKEVCLSFQSRIKEKQRIHFLGII